MGCGVGLLKLYRVGGGDYARFWKYISPMFIGCLAIFGWLRGLTGFGLGGLGGAIKQFGRFAFGFTPAFGRVEGYFSIGWVT